MTTTPYEARVGNPRNARCSLCDGPRSRFGLILLCAACDHAEIRQMRVNGRVK